MEECRKILTDYFRRELPKLEENYQWKIPDIEGFKLQGEKGYKANVELKRFFNSKWNNSDYEDRIRLAKVVVSDWGGVSTNHQSTLESYVAELMNETPSTPIKGVASYSKIYSISDVHKYAIYDARVASCLNAVQFNYNVKKGVAFNYVSGRNKVAGDAKSKRGFSQEERFKVKSLVENGWKRIKRDDTYKIYLDLLNTCLDDFPEYKLYDLEMILFTNAEIECAAAMAA